MDKQQVPEFLNSQLTFIKENNLKELAKVHNQIEEGRSLRQVIEWGGNVVIAEVTLGFIARIERAVENGHDLMQALANLEERLTNELLSNRFTQSSTSKFANAVEGAEAEATSRFCRTLGEWLKIAAPFSN